MAFDIKRLSPISSPISSNGINYYSYINEDSDTQTTIESAGYFDYKLLPQMKECDRIIVIKAGSRIFTGVYYIDSLINGVLTAKLDHA